jgi:hypothetical protein
MNEYWKISLRIICYLVLSSLCFLYFVDIIKFPIKSVKKEPELVYQYDSANDEKLIDLKLKQINGIIRRGIDYKINDYLSNKIDIPKLNNQDEQQIPITDKLVNKFAFFDYVVNSGSAVISGIYCVIFLTFLFQIVLLALSSHFQTLLKFTTIDKLKNFFLYSSEWTINSPPVLGVIGTIFSFGVLITNLDSVDSIPIVFKKNFANAALTTIIGGSVYTINLFINIFTTKNIPSNKEEL